MACSVLVLERYPRTSVFSIAYRNQHDSYQSVSSLQVATLSSWISTIMGGSMPGGPDIPGIQGGSREKVKDSDLCAFSQSKMNVKCEAFIQPLVALGPKRKVYPLQPELVCHGFNCGLG